MDLQKEIQALQTQMVEDRRYLHQNPELSNQEFKTTEFIKRRLSEFGVEIESLDMAVGVSAIVRGKKRGKTICIRHDIDALPIQEKTGLDFISKHDGVSHSCGHDIHTVIALYCAKIIKEHEDDLAGNVRIVFQPAEELGTGAKQMVKAGIMEKEPLNDIVIGLHTHPLTPVGSICLRKGPMEAGTDYLKITVKGKCGHGAYPHDCVDPIVMSAYLITQLQTVISRENQAVKPAVFSLGSIHGGSTHNSIPGEVVMLGTLRTLYPESRTRCLEAINRITKGVCEGMGGEGMVEFDGASIPPIRNQDTIVDDLILAADEILGDGHVIEFPYPSMGSDDFAVFMEYCNGAQFFLGTANENSNSRMGLHNGKNIFDEKSLGVGVAVLTQYIFNQLCEGDNR